MHSVRKQLIEANRRELIKALKWGICPLVIGMGAIALIFYLAIRDRLPNPFSASLMLYVAPFGVPYGIVVIIRSFVVYTRNRRMIQIIELLSESADLLCGEQRMSMYSFGESVREGLRDFLEYLPMILTFCGLAVAIIYFVSEEIARFDDEAMLLEQEKFRYAKYTDTVNQGLASFDWSAVREHTKPFSGDTLENCQVLLVDSETHTLFYAHRDIIPLHRSPKGVGDCDYIVLIDERWADSNVYFEYSKVGKEPTRVPVKYCIWRVSVLECSTRTVVARRSFEDPPRITALEGMIGPAGTQKDYEERTIPRYRLKNWLGIQ